MVRTAVVAACALLLAPGVASAQSESQSAPNYPNSKLKLSVPKSSRAGSVVTVTASGSNALFDPNNALASPSFTVDVFAQDPKVLPTCPVSYSEQLDNVINLGTDAIYQIIRAGNAGQQGNFKISRKYRAGATRRVLYCGYSRLITDDAAVAGYKVTLKKAKSKR
jgi:hypothetical protein